MSAPQQIRHDVFAKRRHAGTARQHQFSDLVGQPRVYLGAKRRELYPERVGCSCRVVQISETDHICPLIVEWRDSFRGIAEPEWLAEVIH